MNRFLVIGFNFRNSKFHALILCKAVSNGFEYRITVMHGEIEKQLCSDNIIREVNGCLQFELSNNELQNEIKAEIAIILGQKLGKPIAVARDIAFV